MPRNKGAETRKMPRNKGAETSLRTEAKGTEERVHEVAEIRKVDEARRISSWDHWLPEKNTSKQILPTQEFKARRLQTL